MTPAYQMTKILIMPRLISCVVYPSSFRELIQVTGASLPSKTVGLPEGLTWRHLARPPWSPPCRGITEDLDPSLSLFAGKIYHQSPSMVGGTSFRIGLDTPPVSFQTLPTTGLSKAAEILSSKHRRGLIMGITHVGYGNETVNLVPYALRGFDSLYPHTSVHRGHLDNTALA